MQRATSATNNERKRHYLPNVFFVYDYLHFSTHFRNNLFYLNNLKTQGNYGKATTPWMWTNKIKIQTKPRHVTFKLTTRSTFRFSPQTMQWYHIRMASLPHVRVKRRVSCQEYINVWLRMMCGYGANPIFFNKKNKDWTSRILANPHPSSDNISFLSYPHLHSPLRWTSYVHYT